jgi:flagellar secretion chaperone FliS
MSYGPGNAMNQYQSVDTYGAAYADPHRLIQMLLEGALSRINGARGAIERGDHAQKGSELGKGITIISGLRDSLNHQQGGELAANLEELYAYMQRRLLDASARNELAALDEVSKLLHEIKSAWDAIGAEVPRQAPPAPVDGGISARG